MSEREEPNLKLEFKDGGLFIEYTYQRVQTKEGEEGWVLGDYVELSE